MYARAVAKTLCDWTKKDIRKHFDVLAEVLAQPRYVCRKCARCAHFPRYLCKPKKLKAPSPVEPA